MSSCHLQRRARVLPGLALAVATAFTPGGAAGQVECDPALVRWAVGPQGYGPVDGRCEGVYDTRVAGSALYPVSLTSAFEAYDLASAADLEIRWSIGADWADRLGPVRLRAIGLDPRRVGYQMDATAPVEAAEFAWPVAVLAANGLERDDIGVLAWSRTDVGGTERSVHLPVEVGRTTSPARDLRLRSFAGTSLRALLVSIFRIEADGTASSVAVERPHPAGVWPAGDVVDVDLAAFGVDAPGLYVVQLAGTTDAGAPAPYEIWVYHAGPSTGPVGRP